MLKGFTHNIIINYTCVVFPLSSSIYQSVDFTLLPQCIRQGNAYVKLNTKLTETELHITNVTEINIILFFNDLWNRLLHPNWQWKVSMLLIIEQYEYFQSDPHVFFYKYCAEWIHVKKLSTNEHTFISLWICRFLWAFPFSCHALLVRYTGLCLLLYDMSNDKMIKWNVPKSSDANKWHLVCKFDVVEQNFLLISCL